MRMEITRGKGEDVIRGRRLFVRRRRVRYSRTVSGSRPSSVSNKISEK
jgi:hypothetical protein